MALSMDSAGYHFSACIVIWQGTALIRDHVIDGGMGKRETTREKEPLDTRHTGHTLQATNRLPRWSVC